MYTEGLSGVGPEVKGNPYYTNEAEESPQLLKAQLKEKVDTLVRELADAQERVNKALGDETIDPYAPKKLVEDLSRDLAEAQKDYEQKFGPETSH